MGNTLGTCLTWIFVGMVTASAGWDWGFHFLSIQIAVFCVVFWFIVDDSPDEHKWISEEEKKFIKDSQAKTISKGKVNVPASLCADLLKLIAYLYLTGCSSLLENVHFASILVALYFAFWKLVGFVPANHWSSQVYD